MGIATTLTKAAAIVTAMGTVGGGAIYLDTSHAKRSEVVSLEAAGKVQTILSLVDQAHKEGAADWLCRSIEAEFIELCTKAPNHYLCTDKDAKRELKAKAGCN